MNNHLRQLYFAGLQRLPDSLSLKIEFFRKHHRRLNLRTPGTFNEKIAWRKLHDRDPKMIAWSDKVAVKPIVAELIGEEHISPNLWIGNDPRAIPLAELPRPFVLKTSHASGTNIFVREDDVLDAQCICRKMESNLRIQLANTTMEWAYKLIPPRLLAETMLLESGNQVLTDYKFHVFGGKAHFIQVDTERFVNHRRSFYDTSWNKLPFGLQFPVHQENLLRPKNIGIMLEIAEILGKQFSYVRIDLYNTAGKIFFGEATFYHAAGYEHFAPQEWDLRWGDLWRLPNI